MKPTRFFHTSEKQYTRQQVEHLVGKYGQDILIGGDEGWDEDFDEAMDAVVDAGALMHVYTMGPGMYEWSKEEASKIKQDARKVGLNVKDKRWKHQWYGGAWLDVSLEKIRRYDRLGFYSIEIDNLDSSFKMGFEWINFYKMFANMRRREVLDIKIMIKNLDVITLSHLAAEVASGSIPADTFAEFAIFEAGTGSSRQQLALCHDIGIQAVTPMNGLKETNDYGTSFEGVPYEVK